MDYDLIVAALFGDDAEEEAEEEARTFRRELREAQSPAGSTGNTFLGKAAE